MHNIPQTELTPQLRRLIQETLSSHEPLKISTGLGQDVIMLAEREYRTLLDSLNQIKATVSQTSQNAPRKQRVFGSARGLIKMADDFDAPLDDFKDYM